MQAQNRLKVIPGQLLVIGFAVMTAAFVGGVGGYEMRGLNLGLPNAVSTQGEQAPNQAAELARHAASERADMIAPGGYSLSGELARHAASERADMVAPGG